MVVTEEVARQKKCIYNYTNNRDVVDYCDASNCMAWRLLLIKHDNKEDLYGYCGLVYQAVPPQTTTFKL